MNLLWRTGLYSLFLTTVNIGSIILGFGIYHLFELVNALALLTNGWVVNKRRTEREGVTPR